MKVKVIESGRKRTAPPVEQVDTAALVAGNSAFAFKLGRAIEQAGSNMIFSPWSISAALGMAYAGARGETECEMATALEFRLEPERLHPAFNSLEAQLKPPGEKQGEGFILRTVNAIWGQKGFEFLSGFLDELAENYGAGMNLVDFINKTEESRVAINEWVSEQTGGKISELVGRGAVDAMTRLVLTNAIYFKGAWKHPFEPHRTSDGLFRLLDAEEIFVPMMSQTRLFNYSEAEGCQAVELPYKGGWTSMLLILPGQGEFESFSRALEVEKLGSIIAGLKPRDVTLTMPRFKFEFSLSLKQALSKLGMANAFTGHADFSGMTGGRELYLQDVLHKAFVAVNEEGTEAAAATAVMVGIKMYMPLSVRMTLDRPFIFLIRHTGTGAILFAGQVVDPGK
ncbi:MAG: serpin family protein [Dehalococcoidaceae bacterium]|nr:serpin family protein [Dehalococcoidaceae bacterium]